MSRLKSFPAPTETMNAVRALESLGTLLLLISVVLAFVKQCSSTNRQALFKGAGGLAIAAGMESFQLFINTRGVL